MGKAMASDNAVPGTKWIIMVALSRSLVLEAADRLLYWIIGFGRYIRRHRHAGRMADQPYFTRRLDRLSLATTALANGDYFFAADPSTGRMSWASWPPTSIPWPSRSPRPNSRWNNRSRPGPESSKPPTKN